MPAIVRLGDTSAGHCFPARPNTQASSNVFVNGKGVHVVGQEWEVHTCGRQSHDGALSQGSSNVFVNGVAVGRVGDAISCGDVCATGSSDVFAN